MCIVLPLEGQGSTWKNQLGPVCRHSAQENRPRKDARTRSFVSHRLSSDTRWPSSAEVSHTPEDQNGSTLSRVWRTQKHLPSEMESESADASTDTEHSSVNSLRPVPNWATATRFITYWEVDQHQLQNTCSQVKLPSSGKPTKRPFGVEI